MIRRALFAVTGSLAGLLIGTALCAWRSPREAAPPAVLAADTDGALQEICIHYRDDFGLHCTEVYTDFFTALPATVRIRVIVETLADYAALLRRLEAHGVPNRERLIPVVTGFPVSPWAKDRFATLRRGDVAILGVPAVRSLSAGPRGNDERVPAFLADSLPHIRCETLPFAFEGGDLIADQKTVFVAANFLERNQPYDPARRDALLATIGATVGRKVVTIGRRAQDVPDHHIGMYLTPLGSDTVTVGDPDLGLQLLPDASMLPEGITVDTNPARYAVFSNVIEELQDKGITTVRVPLLLTTTPRVYVTYNNAIVETRDGQKRIYMPVYGIAKLDTAAANAFEEQGWTVYPVRVDRVFRFTGSLRCLVGIIDRE